MNSIAAAFDTALAEVQAKGTTPSITVAPRPGATTQGDFPTRRTRLRNIREGEKVAFKGMTTFAKVVAIWALEDRNDVFEVILDMGGEDTEARTLAGDTSVDIDKRPRR